MDKTDIMVYNGKNRTINLKMFLLTSIFVIILLLSSSIYAANGYEFKLEYEGDIVENQEKQATVILQGTSATPYTNVRIKIEFVSGPSTPKIMATDTNGTEFNLTDLGYWGPEVGFQVGGDFENKTPIKATFSAPGTYAVKLSLVDVNNSEAVITSNEFTFTVLEEPKTENNVVTNNTTNNNEIDNLPQTGTSIFEYIALGIILGAILFVIYSVVRKR